MSVEFVRKKAAPKGPPPISMAAFKPKHVEARAEVQSAQSDEDVSPEKGRSRGQLPSASSDLYDSYSPREEVRGVQIRTTKEDSPGRERNFKESRSRSRSRSISRSRSRSSSRDRGRVRASQQRRGDSDDDSRSRSYNSDDDDSRSYQSEDSDYYSDDGGYSRNRPVEDKGRSRSSAFSGSARARSSESDKERVKSRPSERRRSDEYDDEEAQPKGSERTHDRKRSEPVQQEEKKTDRNSIAAPAALVRAEAKPYKATSAAESWNEPLGKIRPGKEGIFNYTEVLKCTYRELKKFLIQPVAPGYVYRCYIERSRSGLNAFAPFYSLCADLDDGTGRELIVCKKILRSQTAHYVFSLKQEDLSRDREQRSRLFLGKLRQLPTGEYVLYDSGAQSPVDGESDSKPSAKTDTSTSTSAASREDSLYRKELMLSCYTEKFRPCTNAGLEVCIPNPTTSSRAEGDLLDFTGSKTPMAPHFKTIRDLGKQNELHGDKYFILQEKQSRYDPLSSCLVDFKGRANVGSVKNFQIVEANARVAGASTVVAKSSSNGNGPVQDGEFLLQMGKTTTDCFNMDVKYPLSILQAFSICISRFDAKLSWKG